MIDSAVLDTVLGLIFLFYALALLCSGLVEMIANWVKKRAKYLLRGIRDLLDDMPAKELAVAEKKKGWAQNTAETVYLNSMVERQRYGEMLHAPVPTPPQEPATAVPAGAGSTALPPEQPMHRDKITLSDVMGHALVQPFRHATSLGKPTRNPSYLPSSVFSRTLVDLLTPGSTEPGVCRHRTGRMGAPEFAQVAAVAQQHSEGLEGRGRVVPDRHADVVRPSNGSCLRFV